MKNYSCLMPRLSSLPGTLGIPHLRSCAPAILRIVPFDRNLPTPHLPPAYLLPNILATSLRHYLAVLRTFVRRVISSGHLFPALFLLLPWLLCSFSLLPACPCYHTFSNPPACLWFSFASGLRNFPLYTTSPFTCLSAPVHAGMT